MFSPQHNSKLTVKKYKSAQIECFSFAPNPTSTGEGIPLPTFFAAKINHPSLAQPFKPLVQSINQSKRIYIAPYVAGESEARVGLG